MMKVKGLGLLAVIIWQPSTVKLLCLSSWPTRCGVGRGKDAVSSKAVFWIQNENPLAFVTKEDKPDVLRVKGLFWGVDCGVQSLNTVKFMF